MKALVLVGVAAAAMSAVPASAVAAPSHALAVPAYSCTYDRLANVNADWLKVHTTPDGATVIGQIPRGNTVEFCASSSTAKGGYTWVYGTGSNGGTTLTGWMAENYLTNIRRIA